MKTKHIIAIIVASIGAGGLIVSAIITGIFGLINTGIGKEKTTKYQPVKIENTQTVPIPDISTKEDASTIHPVLPNPQKPIPKSVFQHNSKAKELLDKIISIPDKDIIGILDNVFIELNKSLAEYDEYGETYYFFGVAFCKRGDYYIAINDTTKKAIDSYTDSIHYFGKSELFNYPLSNVLFDRGKSYTALGDIYLNNDLEKSKEYYQKAINDLNNTVKIFPYPENVYFAIANIYQKTKDYEKAIVNYTNALQTANEQYKPTKKEIFFERSNAYYEFGLVNFQNKNYEKAIQNYKDAIEDNFENGNAHYELGKTYCQIKMWKEGVHQFDLIIEHGFRNIDLKMVKNSREFAISIIE